MAINGRQQINVGLPNESIGSDSLYTAFNKINDNFETIFSNASPYTNVNAGIGINVAASNSALTITNTGVISINAGTGIVVNQSNGNVIISSTSGNGNGGGSLNSVGLVPVSNNRLTVTNSPLVSSGNMSIDLSTTGVSPGTYTYPTVAVDAYGRIVAISNANSVGTVTSVGLAGGGGISITNSPITTAGTITVVNTGVTRLTAGQGIEISSPNGNITISAPTTGGTVTSVGITSNQLIISNSPVVSSGTIAVNLPNNLSIAGNITANGRFVGNGSGITGITVTANNVSGLGNIAFYNLDGNASNVLHGDGTWSADITNYGNSNVANYLPTFTGNISAGNANLGNSVTANYFIGNLFGQANSAATATSATTANSATTAGTVTTAAQPNITSVGTLSSLAVTGNITAGDANLGNAVNANFFIGNGFFLTGLNPSNVVANTANFASFAGNVTVNAQPNITSVGTLTGVSVNGNITAANITANTGIFSGNGAGLTNLAGANVSGQVNFAATANSVAGANVSGQVNFAATANSVAGANVSGTVSSATTADTVTSAAQSNITSVGTLTGLTVSATITGSVSGSAGTAGTVTTAAQPNITSVGTLTSLSVTNSATANILIANTYLKLTGVAFSALPAAGTAGAGSRAFITDGNLAAATNFAAQVQGGGSNNVPVYSDGSNWLIG